MAGAKSKSGTASPSKKPSTTASQPKTAGVLAGEDAGLAVPVSVKNEPIYLRIKHHKSTFILPCSTGDKVLDVQMKLCALLNPLKQDSFEYVPHAATGSPTFSVPSKGEDVRLYQPAAEFSLVSGAPAGSKIAQRCSHLKDVDSTLFHLGIGNDTLLIMTIKDGERFEPVDVPPMSAI